MAEISSDIVVESLVTPRDAREASTMRQAAGAQSCQVTELDDIDRDRRTSCLSERLDAPRAARPPLSGALVPMLPTSATRIVPYESSERRQTPSTDDDPSSSTPRMLELPDQEDLWTPRRSRMQSLQNVW